MTPHQRERLLKHRRDLVVDVWIASPVAIVVTTCALGVLLWAPFVIMTDRTSDASTPARVVLSTMCLILAVGAVAFICSYCRSIPRDRASITKIDAMLAARTDAEMLAACDMPPT